jgi:hypothetical protein
MRILEIAFSAFFDDTKKLVSDGVKRDIAYINEQADTPSELEAARLDARRREYALKSWLALARPLAYGNDDKSDAHKLLVNAVVADKDLICYGLPNLQEHSMAPSALAESLLRFASAPHPSRPIAPVLSSGTFLPILCVALEAITSMNSFMDKETLDLFLSKALLNAIHLFKIRFVPSHKSRSSSSRAPPRTAVFNSWASLGLQDQQHRHLSLNPSSEPSSSRASEVALTNALAFDCHAEWTASTVSLATLHSVLHRTSLPSDFSPPISTKAPYVDQTYVWVRNRYDGTKAIHHLAVIISIIASSLLPSLFMPTSVNKTLFLQATSRQAVTDLYHSIPWVSRNKKGMTDKSIFISMITTFVIALYEDESPLRLHMAQSSKMGLGDPWTSKHCTTFPSLFSTSLLFTFLIFFSFSCQRDLLYNPHPSWYSLGCWPWCL